MPYRGVIHPPVFSSICTLDMKATLDEVYSANVSHMPRLCLLDIAGALYIGHESLLPKAYFTF